MILYRDICSVCLLEEKVQAFIWSEIHITSDDMNLGIRGKIDLNIFLRSIIEDENFSILIRLIETASECLYEVLSWIKCHDQDRDER